jgi:hypothetical protein
VRDLTRLRGGVDSLLGFLADAGTQEEAGVAIGFSIQKVNASFKAHFNEPAFHLFADLPDLLKQLFAMLGRHGLRLSDTKFESGGDNLGEVHLRCYLFDFRTTLRIYLDRIDLTSMFSAGDPLAHDEVAIQAVSAALEHLPSLGFRAYNIATGLHGVLVGTSPGDFLSRFGAAAPYQSAPLVGVGTVFYYGAVLNQLASSVTVDLSRLVENGVFIQVNTIYDAREIDPGKIAAASRSFLDGILAELGLTIEN